MGKQGPCYHCGVTSTPLWRNGPPEKPVLCNACGSRWRTKGTLANYTPLHARAEPQEFEDYRASKVKVLSMRNKEAKVLKRRYDNDAHATEFGGALPDCNQGFRKGLEEDTSNRSSSGSAISNSESCAQYGGGGGDVSELTGPSQPVVWDTVVPSRKRTCVTRPKPSPVEKLTKDLYTIWHEQQSSCASASSEEELLLESDKPMVSVEIGHGSVLIRHPSSIAREEESEASSLSIDNKQQTLNSQRLVFPSLMEEPDTHLSSKGVDKMKKPANIVMEHEQLRSARDKDEADNMQMMTYQNSPLCHVDLQDIVNIEKFTSHLTKEEQQQLLKFLPSVDASGVQDRESSLVSRLSSMFNSPQFKENLGSFQKLLADGLFDNSPAWLKAEDGRILKKSVLCNLTKSKWVEEYKVSKDSRGKHSTNQSELAREFKPHVAESSASVKRLHDGLHHRFSGAKATMKSPRRIITTSGYDQKESSFFSATGLLSSHYDDGSSQVLHSSHFADENSEQDLLLNVPSYGSFPQAELLPNSSLGAQASTSSSSVYPNFVHP